jgi:hypothetical protein
MSGHSEPTKPTPSVPEYFDYTRAAREAGLTPEQLRSVIRLFEADYPHDVMLRELHILRACNAIRRGTVTIQQVLSSHEERAA